MRAYCRFLETELKKAQTEIGFLQSENQELRYMPEDKRDQIIGDLERSNKDLLFKNNKLTTEVMDLKGRLRKSFEIVKTSIDAGLKYKKAYEKSN